MPTRNGQGLTLTLACKKKIQVVESVQESISEVKSIGRKDREKEHVYFVIVGSILKK